MLSIHRTCLALALAGGVLALAQAPDAPLTGNAIIDARQLIDAGKYEAAIEQLQPPAVDADSADVQRLLAKAQAALGQTSDAKRHYKKAIELDDRAETRVELGRLYASEQHYALAVEQFEQAAASGFDDPSLHADMGRAYLHLDDLFGHVRTIDAEGAEPGQIVNGWYLIEAVPDQPDRFLAAPRESAVYQLDLATQQNDDPRLLLEYAALWLGSQRYQQAVEIYKRVESFLPRSDLSPEEVARFRSDFAEALYGADDLDGYLAQMQAIADGDPARSGIILADAYVKIADRHNQRGDLLGYLDYLKRATAERPDRPDLQFRLGIAYWEAGNAAQAARHWRMTLQMQPGHPYREWMLEQIALVSAQQD